MFVKPYYSRNTDHSVQNARRLESNAIVMASQTRDGTSISLALLARLCIRTAYAHFFVQVPCDLLTESMFILQSSSGPIPKA
jgi:hypothetical protein